MAVKESDVVKLKHKMANNEIGGAYLFYGEEVYLRDLYLKRFEALIPNDGFEEFNLIPIDGRQMDYDLALDAVESFPMCAERKLVIVRDSGIFKKAKESDTQFWTKEIKSLPEYCILIFVEDDIDKRSSLYKTISKSGTAVEFAPLKPYEQCTWVQGEVLRAKRKMNKDVIEYFVGIAQGGLSNLNNELQKLFTYCDTEITETDVKRVVSKSLEVRVFDLTDSIMEKNADKTLKILGDLKTTKESAFNILYLLNSAFDKMLRSKLMFADGATNAEVEKKLGLPGFIAKKYYNGARGFSQEFLIGRVMRVPEYDLAIKQGKITEWEALYDFIFEALRS